MIYQIENKANNKVHIKEFNSDDECFEWIVKNLNLNLGWSYSIKDNIMDKDTIIIEADKITVQGEKVFVEVEDTFKKYNIFHIGVDGILCNDMKTLIKYKALEIVK